MQVKETYKENNDEKEKRNYATAFRSKTLSLKGEGLTDEWWKTLKDYPTVEVLIIDQNNISCIPEKALQTHFPRLKILSMRRNKIKNLHVRQLAHPTLEILDLEGCAELVSLLSSEEEGAAAIEQCAGGEGGPCAPVLRVVNLTDTTLTVVEKTFFLHLPQLQKLELGMSNVCASCGFGFLASVSRLVYLKISGIRTSLCARCNSTEGNAVCMNQGIYSMICNISGLRELDLSGPDMSIEYFVFTAPLPQLRVLKMRGRLVRDISLRDWPGILKTIQHLTLGVVESKEEDRAQQSYQGDTTFYAERILEATNLETLCFESDASNRRIKFSLGTKKVFFPYLRCLVIKNCDLRPLTFFNRENAPSLDSLEIISKTFSEGYFYTIKKRLGNRLRHLRIGIEQMDASQAIYDLFTFIRSHKALENLHLQLCDTIAESQSFYKYFTDKPPLKELYLIGRVSPNRMKRILHQLGHYGSLRTLLLDIGDPCVVMENFSPPLLLREFLLKNTHGRPGVECYIPPIYFENILRIKTLTTLDLSHCGLVNFPDYFVPNLPQLSHLYLNGNKLGSLSSTMVSTLCEIREKEVYVDISDNLLNRDEVVKRLINNSWLGLSGFILY